MSSLRDYVDKANPHGTPRREPARLQTAEVFRQLRVQHLGELVGSTDEYSVAGTFTPVRDLDTDTATLSDLVAFVATLVLDLKTKGPLE